LSLANPMLRALIFDFDGLILDTETPLLVSWREVFARYLVPITERALIGLIELSREPEEAYRLLGAAPGAPVDRERLRAERLAREALLISEQEPMPGLTSLLGLARAARLKMAVASSSSRTWIVPQLARLGLASSFDCIRCRDDVDRVKPDPELYLAVLADMGFKSGEAVAFEDSPVGAEAALHAGVACVAVPNDTTADLAWGPVALTVPSLAAVTLEQLAALVRHIENEPRRV
jgi:HAD superfamily hydrolase (TIGR01509 family)